MELEFSDVRIWRIHRAFRFHLTVLAERWTILIGDDQSRSTFLQMIAGFEPMTQGRILWKGQDLGHFSPCQRPVTSVFESGNLFPSLTLWENIALGLEGGVEVTSLEKFRIQEVVERVGLSARVFLYPENTNPFDHYLAIAARILLRRQPILVMDKPFDGIEGKERSHLFDLFSHLQKIYHLTMITAIEDRHEASHYAHDMIRFDERGRSDLIVAVDGIEANRLKDGAMPSVTIGYAHAI